MFEYIKGKVASKRVDYAVIDVGGIAYRLYISLSTYDKIREENVKLYIYNHVREDAFVLYGFYTEEERDMFATLLNASGIGPKIAVAILSTYETEELRSLILMEEIKMLTKIPGLGIKKAQKLVLDIKDKLKNKTISIDSAAVEKNSVKNNIKEDVYLALESLGYNEKDIAGLLGKEDFGKFQTVEEAIKVVLKNIKLK